VLPGRRRKPFYTCHHACVSTHLRALSWHGHDTEFLSMRCLKRTRQVVASTCARDTISIPICIPICRPLCRQMSTLLRRPICRPLCRPICRLVCRLFCRLTRILFFACFVFRHGNGQKIARCSRAHCFLSYSMTSVNACARLHILLHHDNLHCSYVSYERARTPASAPLYRRVALPLTRLCPCRRLPRM
jgi:hypothetical protein